MGRIAKFIELIRSTALSYSKGDIGGGDVLRAENFSAAGDDSVPLPGDYAMFVETPESGNYACVGYIDLKNTKASAAGEKRIYARSGDGAQIVQLHLKNTGEASLLNDSGYVTLESGGDVLINGVRITSTGQIITPEGVTLNTHKHSQGSDSNGDSEQDTGGPLNA